MPHGRVKFQTTSKNNRRYYTSKRLTTYMYLWIHSLLSWVSRLMPVFQAIPLSMRYEPLYYVVLTDLAIGGLKTTSFWLTEFWIDMVYLGYLKALGVFTVTHSECLEEHDIFLNSRNWYWNIIHTTTVFTLNLWKNAQSYLHRLKWARIKTDLRSEGVYFDVRQPNLNSPI